jgi:AcrR family transcriptional regulator
VPRAGLTPAAVVDAALAIVDQAGVDGLTLARVAQRTGVAAPSLYKHVDGLPALRRLVRLRVLAEVADQTRRQVTGRSGDDAVRRLAGAYRAYMRRHPHRYPLVEAAALTGDDELRDASEGLVEVVFAVLRGYGLDGDELIHATRSLRAVVGGFVRLESSGGFGRPQDVDRSFEYLVDLYVAGLAGLANGAGGRPAGRPAGRSGRRSGG